MCVIEHISFNSVCSVKYAKNQTTPAIDHNNVMYIQLTARWDMCGKRIMQHHS